MLKQKYGSRFIGKDNLIGCSPEELRIYIEQQFETGMTWDNWGKDWELDHIMPVASFKNLDTDELELYQMNHWSNLRPLWKEENAAKWDKEPVGFNWVEKNDGEDRYEWDTDTSITGNRNYDLVPAEVAEVA